MRKMCQLILTKSTHLYDGVYKAIIDYVFDNSILFHMLLSEKVIQIFKMRFLTTYHIQGCIAIICTWVNENFSHSKEEVLGFLRKVNENFDKILV